MDQLVLPKLHAGRPPNEIIYKDVSYDGKDYTVGIVSSKGHHVKFVIDRNDSNEVKEHHWHVTAGAYISHTVNVLEENQIKKKALYLHNLVIKRPTFLGKGQPETVDHISRNGFDNRKENLRLSTQSEQNLNQRKKARTAQLPEGCPIRAEDIPRHIWYVRANGNHGDRFAIEFKTEGLCWKTTSVGVSETLYKDALPVKVSNLKLNLDYTTNVGSTAESRKTFEETLKKEIATSLGLTDPSRITITDLSPGSVNVTFVIEPSTSADDPTAQ